MAYAHDAGARENELFARWRENPTPENRTDLVMALRRHVFAVCWNRLGYQKTMEIANDATFVVLTKPETYTGKSKFSTWFQSIVKHMATRAKWLADNRNKWTEVALEDNHSVSMLDIEVNDMVSDLEKILSDDDNKLVGFLLEGRNPEEISKELNVSISTVRSRIWRLRLKVKGYLSV